MTDIHNMILFLQNDTSKDHPVGFEKFRRNIFDPEEDPVSAFVEDHKSESTLSDGSVLPADVHNDSELNGVTALMHADMKLEPITNHSNLTKKMKVEKSGVRAESMRCIRIGCQQMCRFDSVFCSDSCGVSTLEMDLLSSLKYVQDIHPSTLRS